MEITWEGVAVALGAVVAAVTGIGAVVGFLRGGEKQFRGAWKGALEILEIVTWPIHGPYTIGAAVKRGERERAGIIATLAGIERELKPNGWASIKDAVSFLLAEEKERQRGVPYPLFICDGDARNILVSDAYCSLVGIESEAEILALDWSTFLFQEDVRGYLEAFLASAQRRGMFRGVARMVNAQGMLLGQWEVRARPMLHQAEARLIYKGVLRPVDEVARAEAKRLGFRWA